MTAQYWPTPRAVPNPGWQVTQRVRFADEPSLAADPSTAATYTVVATTNLVSVATRPAADGRQLVIAVDWRKGIRGPISPSDGVAELVATNAGRCALLADLITGARQIAPRGWSFICIATPGPFDVEGVPAADDLSPRLFDLDDTTLTA